MSHTRTEMDAPRPDAAPVTTATLFANLCILKSLPQVFFIQILLKIYANNESFFEESSLRMYYLVLLEILKPIRYLQLSVFVLDSSLDSSRAPPTSSGQGSSIR